MKYVALLRGINVGGNNLIKMSELKAAFEHHGFTEVLTYINSGNVLFSSEETNPKKLTDSIEKMLSQTFSYQARVVIRSHQQIKRIVKDVPKEWITPKDIRCYVSFLSDSVTDEEINAIPLREGVDAMKVMPGVLYFTTDSTQLTKSHMNKMMGMRIYKEMTMRNITTVKKILDLLEMN